MAKQLQDTILSLLPSWSIRSLLSMQPTRHLLFSLVRERDVVIPSGAAKGLRFNAGLSNPEYALGSNELPVQQVIEQQLHEGDIFYDIGTNVGFFMMIAARRVGNEGHVYAFEPLPANVEVIRHNVAINGFENTTLFERAVADRTGTGELLVASYSGGSALSTANLPPPDLTGTLVVDLVSIDELIHKGEIQPPAVVKVDVEGAEIGVFKGMTETLRNHRPIIIYEIDDGRPDEYERKAAECRSFLEEHSYTIKPLAVAYAQIEWHVGHFLATYSG